MATYKIAPDSTGEIGMAQMRYGLHNKTDYNAANALASQTDMLNLVSNTTTYQGDLVSKTWNTSQPYGFAEMYGQTWDDVSTFTLYITAELSTGCEAYSGTVKKNGAVVSTITKLSGQNPTISTANLPVLATDTILVEGTSNIPTGAGCSAYLGTDLAVGTGTLFGYTNRFIVSSPGSNSYSFNPNDTTEFAINFAGTPTS